MSSGNDGASRLSTYGEAPPRYEWLEREEARPATAPVDSGPLYKVNGYIKHEYHFPFQDTPYSDK